LILEINPDERLDKIIEQVKESYIRHHLQGKSIRLRLNNAAFRVTWFSESLIKWRRANTDSNYEHAKKDGFYTGNRAAGRASGRARHLSTVQDDEEDRLHEERLKEIEAQLNEKFGAPEPDDELGELPYDAEADRKRWDELEKDFDRIFEDAARPAD
jgi:hypothetical protein